MRRGIGEISYQLRKSLKRFPSNDGWNGGIGGCFRKHYSLSVATALATTTFYCHLFSFEENNILYICILQNVKSDPKKFLVQTLGRAHRMVQKPHTQAWFVGLVLLLLMKVCVF